MEKTIPATPGKTRYRQLDSLRGLAALFVFFTHFLGLNANQPLFKVLIPSPLGVIFNGNAAVMFFFVLSGFVLSLPFVSNEKPLKLTEFYTKRIFRIYPAFIFAILFSIILKQFFYDRVAVASAHGWINNFWNWEWNKENIRETWHTLLLIGPDFNINLIDPPIWSLVIEMKMSIILPFFIVIVSRNSPALNFLFFFLILYLTYQYDSWAMGVFYLGILIAKYKEYISGKVSSWPLIFVAGAVLFSLFLYNNNYEFSILISRLKSPLKYVWSKYLMAAGSGIIIVVVLAREKITKFFEHRIFTFFGEISYSFYLVHMPVLLTMYSVFSNRFFLSPVYIFLSAFISAVLFSYLINVFIEKPFQKFAVRLTEKYKVLKSLPL